MRIAVVGGGVLGTSVATGLASVGHEVDLFERRPSLFMGATMAGEGKIHLGHVYGLGGHATSEVMLGAALEFDRCLERLVGGALDWDRLRGGSFRYVVAPDSLLGVDELLAHGERLEAIRSRLLDEDPSLTYLGAPLDSCRFRPVRGESRRFDVDERTIDVGALLAVLERSVEARSVRIRVDTRVEHVDRTMRGWCLRTIDGTGTSDESVHDVVVDCAWDDASRLDRLAGGPATEPNLRLRTFVHGRIDLPACAFTIVQGPYGDVVVRPDGRLYAAWYPTGLLAFANRSTSPAEWDSALEDPAVRDAQIESTLAGLRAFVPELGDVRDATVHARVVVARGTTDIDDPGSGLHHRDEIGCSFRDGWISVGSTKLTTAPIAALDVVRCVAAAAA